MVSFDIVLPIIIGIIVGLIFLIFFTHFGRKGSDSYATIFGISSNSITTSLLLFIIVSGFIGLSAISIIVKDLDYPVKNPWKFTLETLLMAILPSLTLLAIIYIRTNKINSKDMIDFGLLTAKFGIFHILLQFSRYYTYIFS